MDGWLPCYRAAGYADGGAAVGPAPERPIVDERQQPAILRNGIITPAEAEKLFGM